MRKTTIIISSLIILAGVIFYSCSKEESNLKGSANNNKPNSLKSITENPFDFIGEIHNKGLYEVKKAAINAKNNNTQFNLDYCVSSFIFNEIELTNTIDEPELLMNNINNAISNANNYKLYYVIDYTLSDEKFVEFVDNFNFTSFQKEKIILVNNALGNSENVLENLSEIEADVLNSDVEYEEQVAVLCVISIAKYSYDFWSKNQDILSEQKGKPTVSGAAKSDLGGAITGAGYSITSGASTTGLVFGPGGYVLTTAGAAVTGALWSSGLYLASWGWF